MQSEIVQKAVSILKNDGVIIHPTDTCYGLACSMFSQKALKKLYLLKKMAVTKPVSILVASIEEAKLYGEWSNLADELAQKFWPGPLTIIMNRRETLPQFLNYGIPAIGIRFLNHALSLEIIRGLGHPIATTSANITGEPEVYCAEKISELLQPVSQPKVDLIIDGGPLPKIPPSTLVDIFGGQVHVLRRGPISF